MQSLSPRRGSSPLQSGATIHAAFALRLRARPPEKHFRGHLCVHFHYSPMARHHPKDDAVNRFQKFGFPPSCYPSYEASDFYLGGFVFPLNTPAFAGHTTGRALFEHPAFRQISPSVHGRLRQRHETKHAQLSEHKVVRIQARRHANPCLPRSLMQSLMRPVCASVEFRSAHRACSPPSRLRKFNGRAFMHSGARSSAELRQDHDRQSQRCVSY